jgi:hypothetical protein
VLILLSVLCIFCYGFEFGIAGGKEGFQNQVKEYNKNPTSAPLLTGLIVSVVHSVGFPIDPAIATVVVLYILKVGINIFCDYINPEATKK